VAQGCVDSLGPQRVLHGAQLELHGGHRLVRHRDPLAGLAVAALLEPPPAEEGEEAGGECGADASDGGDLEVVLDAARIVLVDVDGRGRSCSLVDGRLVGGRLGGIRGEPQTARGLVLGRGIRT